LVFVLKITVLDLILTQVIPYLDIMIQYYISNTNTIKKSNSQKNTGLLLLLLLLLNKKIMSGISLRTNC